jgi:hypothetical protein
MGYGPFWDWYRITFRSPSSSIIVSLDHLIIYCVPFAIFAPLRETSWFGTGGRLRATALRRQGWERE